MIIGHWSFDIFHLSLKKIERRALEGFQNDKCQMSNDQ